MSIPKNPLAETEDVLVYIEHRNIEAEGMEQGNEVQSDGQGNAQAISAYVAHLEDEYNAQMIRVGTNADGSCYVRAVEIPDGDPRDESVTLRIYPERGSVMVLNDDLTGTIIEGGLDVPIAQLGQVIRSSLAADPEKGETIGVLEPVEAAIIGDLSLQLRNAVRIQESIAQELDELRR
jgi:hypothetical protein